MVKKDDGNDLSLLDGNQVLKDAHNRDDRALNVTSINDLVPRAFSRVELEYVTSGNGLGEISIARYYSPGKKTITAIETRDDYQGEPEITTINTLTSTPISLSGKYFIIYDDVGTVGVWFDVDNASIMPITGALRDIEVDLLSTDTNALIASKLAITMNGDLKFVASSATTYAYLTASTVGNLLNASDVNTGLSISIQNGVAPNTLNNKYFYLYSANDVIEYYVWYNVDTMGTDPAIVGKTGIEVALDGNDPASVVATKTAIEINDTEKFNCQVGHDGILYINNARGGITTSTVDVNTSFHIRELIAGEDRALIATIFLEYDANDEIISIERED